MERYDRAIVVILASLLLAGCRAAGPSPAGESRGLPAYYPSRYTELVQASRSEPAGLLVYSIMSQKNWDPVAQAFQRHYPWIRLSTLDLGSYEVFERYYSEAFSNARTADLLVTSSIDAWQAFLAKEEQAPYDSPEAGRLPAWAKPAHGVYAVSADPMVLMWSKTSVKKPPTSMTELAAMVEADPAAFRLRITSYDAEKSSVGFLSFWFWIKHKGDGGWKMLESIGRSRPSLQSSAGRMVDAALAGESTVGFFVSTISLLPRFPQVEPVLG